MEVTYCAQCGVEIEGKGIAFRSRTFCGDECCEVFEAEFVDKGEPAPDELIEDDLGEADLAEDELGYRSGDDSLPKDDDLDDDLDDFAIDPDDF